MKKIPKVIETLEEVQELLGDIGENAPDSSPRQVKAFRLYNELESIIDDLKDTINELERRGIK